MKDEAEANAEADKKAKEEVEKLNGADALIFSTEKQLKEYGDKIPADKRSAIESAMASLKEAHKAENLDAIDRYEAELNNAWMVASEDMYKAGQQPGGQPQQEPAGNHDGGVADAEYEEVK